MGINLINSQMDRIMIKTHPHMSTKVAIIQKEPIIADESMI